MSERAKYKHNFCLSFSIVSNDAPDAVGAEEMRKVIADVLRCDDECLLDSVRLEDTENLHPRAVPTKPFEAVLMPVERDGAEYVGTVRGIGDVRVAVMGDEVRGKLKGADKDRF